VFPTRASERPLNRKLTALGSGFSMILCSALQNPLQDIKTLGFCVVSIYIFISPPQVVVYVPISQRILSVVEARGPILLPTD
jgi:hypothetical protein